MTPEAVRAAAWDHDACLNLLLLDEERVVIVDPARLIEKAVAPLVDPAGLRPHDEEGRRAVKAIEARQARGL